jgi:hypothetical protein
MYRVAGGIAALVFAAILVWVAVLSFGSKPVVVPTVHVAPAGAKGPHTPGQAETVLAERTRLQDESSVSNGKNTAQVLTSNRSQLEMARGVPQPHSLVAGWLKRDDLKDSQQLLHKPEYTEGISNVPYTKSNVFVQPEGRDWRRDHNGTVRYGGGWIIFGVALALALFLLVFFGYITLPFAAPVALAIGYGLLTLWRRRPRRRSSERRWPASL